MPSVPSKLGLDRIENLRVSISDWNTEHAGQPVTIIFVPMRKESTYDGPCVIGASITPDCMIELYGPDQASWARTLLGLPVMVLP